MKAKSANNILESENQKKLVNEIFVEIPKPSSYQPVRTAIDRAKEINEDKIAATLGFFATMPPSTSIIANPVMHHTNINCDGTEVNLGIRSFTIRGIIPESDIINEKAGPVSVIYTGLLGQKPTSDEALTRIEILSDYINQTFFDSFRKKYSPDKSLIRETAELVREYPGLGPEVAIQLYSTKRKAYLSFNNEDKGINDDRLMSELLAEMIVVHMENVAVGTVSIYINHLLKSSQGLSVDDIVQETEKFISALKNDNKSVFQVCYEALLEGVGNENVHKILERMGTIQIHHGSAGSNMVARYMTTLHTLSVSDFFTAAHIALDGARHFGAIHDMSHFVQELEILDDEEQKNLIKDKILGGGLPTFGHPEIASAGRNLQIEQDPRPAIYISPLFDAIDRGDVKLENKQLKRLAIAQKIYKTAFAHGIVKPNKENELPLRLAANTDFGAWCVQEALNIKEENRTFLTYVFRGFGWMMDALEQLQQKMIRPVIPPAPEIIPSNSEDETIPKLVSEVHNRLVSDNPFIKSED